MPATMQHTQQMNDNASERMNRTDTQ